MAEGPSIPAVFVTGPFAGQFFYSRNRWGPYNCDIRGGVAPYGSGAVVSAEVCSAIMKTWVTLTSEEQISWTSIAKDRRITNYNAFVSVNLHRAQQSQSIIRTPL